MKRKDWVLSKTVCVDAESFTDRGLCCSFFDPLSDLLVDGHLDPEAACGPRAPPSLQDTVATDKQL